MIRVRILFGMSRFSDLELSEFTAFIVSCLTGNTNFQTPYPPLVNITSLRDLFDAAILTAEDGTRSDKARRDELRLELENAMILLASYVEDNCQNNEVILLSSGFGMHKMPELRALPTKPQSVKVKDGVQSGEVVVTYQKGLHATVHIARYTNDLNSGIWKISEPSSRGKIGIEDLEVGKNVWVQVKAVNSNGISGWSDPGVLLVR